MRNTRNLSSLKDYKEGGSSVDSYRAIKESKTQKNLINLSNSRKMINKTSRINLESTQKIPNFDLDSILKNSQLINEQLETCIIPDLPVILKRPTNEQQDRGLT